MLEFLKKVPLFNNLPDSDLERLGDMLETVELEHGEELFAEGDEGDKAYLIEEGKLEILKTSGNREVLLAARGTGEVIGELALLENKPRMASAKARGHTVLLAIGQEQLNHLLKTSPSAAEAMYYTILARWRNSESQYRQSEKMIQLGTLAAGVAHELNNPAAAVKRGATQLEEAMQELSHTDADLHHMDLTSEQKVNLEGLTKQCRFQAAQIVDMDLLERSDREYELETWLEDRGIEDAWELAPVLVSLNYSDEELEKLSEDFHSDQLPVVIRWLNANYSTYNLLAEIRQGAERISGIVKALKTYSYLDQAPIQNVDVHQGLNDTLLIMNHKLKGGPQVRRDYGDDVPTIQGYGSELNQVWTNLIDNAADALAENPPENPQITLRTRLEDDWVLVEIEDNGPGIPEEIQDKIFHPFFTTKPPGVGTGMGLDISYNIVVHKHRGDMKVISKPGRTVFQVWLPVNFEEAGALPETSVETN